MRAVAAERAAAHLSAFLAELDVLAEAVDRAVGPKIGLALRRLGGGGGDLGSALGIQQARGGPQFPNPGHCGA